MLFPGPLVAWALHSGGVLPAFAAYHLWCVAGIVCVGVRGGVGRRFVYPIWIPLGIGCVASAALWNAGGAGVAAGVGGSSLAGALKQVGVTRSVLWWLVPYFSLVNPLVEEWFWRGAVAGWFRERRPVGWFGIGFPAVCFGVWHAAPVSVLFPVWGVSVAVPAIALGGFWGECLRRRGASLWELVLWHGFAVDLPVAVGMARALFA